MTVREQDTPGYAEKTPASREEARRPDPRKPPNPDEGGLERDPEPDIRDDAE